MRQKLIILDSENPATKSNLLSKASTNRDYHISKEEIFRLRGNVYAFDSTTTDLRLSAFKRVLFERRKDGSL